MLKTDKALYLKGLYAEIERLKLKKKRSLFRMSDEVTDNVIGYVKNHFGNLPEYDLQVRKCARCKNEWDIIIVWGI